MAKKLRAGIVGCGRIASLFAADKKRKGIVTHAQAYLRRPDTELAAVCDSDPGRLQNFASAWGDFHRYTDFREMLAKEKLDVLSVCTPPASHYEIVREALRAGARNIFCEKPLAATLLEADELIALAESRGAHVSVNHSRRWDGMEQKIARYIRSGKLGKIRTADCYYTAGIANTGSHLVDLLRMVTGHEILSVQAFDNGLCGAADPTPDVRFAMSGGYSCFLHGLSVGDYLMFEIDLYGTLGRLRIQNSGFDCQLWKCIPHKKFTGYKQLSGSRHGFGPGYKEVLKNAVSNVVSVAKGKGKSGSTAEDGRSAMEAIAACRLSLKESGRVISLPVEDRSVGL